MDPHPFEMIPSPNHDLVMVYDYRDLMLPELDDLLGETYENLHLVAWSMGVWAAGFLPLEIRNRFASTTAVNGTLTPIDKRYGIDPAAFTNMIETFSSASLEQFYLSMFTERTEAEQFLAHRPQRSPAMILEELICLRNSYETHGPARDIFTRKLVGSRDRIFPARNQIKSWGRDRCIVIKAPHFPFYGWPGWDHLIHDT